MTIRDQIIRLACKKFDRHPKLIRALYDGHKELYCYCLERTLPPMQERTKMTSAELTAHVKRAQTWYGRLLRFLPVDTVTPKK